MTTSSHQRSRFSTPQGWRITSLTRSGDKAVLSRQYPIPCSLFPDLLVPERLDGVKIGGADGGNHAADKAGDDENRSGHKHRGWRNKKANIRGLGILGQGAIKRDSSHHRRHEICQTDSRYAAYAGDSHGLSHEIDKDVMAARAKGFFNADLAGALLHGHQHDVH